MTPTPNVQCDQQHCNVPAELKVLYQRLDDHAEQQQRRDEAVDEHFRGVSSEMGRIHDRVTAEQQARLEDDRTQARQGTVTMVGFAFTLLLLVVSIIMQVVMQKGGHP